MPSSEERRGFVPLGGADRAEAFRALGTPSPAPVEEPPPPPPEPDPRVAAYAAGVADARREAAADQDALAREVAGVVHAVGAWRRELRTRYTETMVALALAVARRVVGEALDAQPERWVPIVADAIRRLVDREHVTVRVRPRLAACLREHAAALVADDGGAVRVVEDATLAVGACRVESRAGDVDCGLETQLAAVAEALGVRTEREPG
jgi:flagellar assembly protein FliH